MSDKDWQTGEHGDEKEPDAGEVDAEAETGTALCPLWGMVRVSGTGANSGNVC